jgi:hypothetical protein
MAFSRGQIDDGRDAEQPAAGLQEAKTRRHTKETDMMATTIIRTAWFPVLAVAVLLGAMTSAHVGPAPTQRVVADRKPTPPAW